MTTEVKAKTQQRNQTELIGMQLNNTQLKCTNRDHIYLNIGITNNTINRATCIIYTVTEIKLDQGTAVEYDVLPAV